MVTGLDFRIDRELFKTLGILLQYIQLEVNGKNLILFNLSNFCVKSA